MRVSIPDLLYERLLGIYKTPQAVDRAATSACELLSVQQKGRTLTLEADQIGELERLLGSGSLLSAPDLMSKVHALADLKVGTISLPLDASDLSRMQQRAARRDLSVDTYLTLMLARFKEDWLMIGEPRELETAAGTK
jgi:hypothetical protein